MYCQECGNNIPQESKFCPECGFNYQTGSSQPAPPVTGTTQQATPVQGDVRQTDSTPQVAPQQPSTQFNAGSQGVNSNLIYSKNPPLSPNMCWLNIFWWGIPHLMHGQTGKGILLALLYLVVFGCAGISTVITIATVAGLIIPLAIWVIPTAIIILDSYKVGKTLASGKPVGKWSFFPSP